MEILLLFENSNFSKHIKYTFNLIFSIYGIPYNIEETSFLDGKDVDLHRYIIISYGRHVPDINAKRHIHIYASEFFSDTYGTPSSLPRLPLVKIKTQRLGVRRKDIANDIIPVIYPAFTSNISSKQYVSTYVGDDKRIFSCYIDFIASTFFLVTRYEEIIIKERDEHGRFPASASLAYKENFLIQPVVNQYIEVLWDWIESFNLDIKRKKIWGNRNFTVCLTHDIEEIRRYKLYPPLLGMKEAMEQKEFRRSLMIFIDYVLTKSGYKKDLFYDTFDYAIDLERQYNFISSFYFLANNKRYSLDNQWLQNLILRLDKEGFEVGLHVDFNAYNNRDIIVEEKGRLEKIVRHTIVGGRQHYLKWNAPETWRHWQSAGMKYDSTVGFYEHEGFRCGICLPFKPYDVLENKTIDLWEVPLTVMDGTLPICRKMSVDEAFDQMIRLLDFVERYQGVLVLLWHTVYMTNLFTPKWKELFQNIYSVLSKRNCHVTSVEKALQIYEQE